ncbi:class I SAM-dependent methyltransferase [Enterococcus faecium]|uniref:class I SAM-dependent methyltransferase n=1 Tax=Enterococcus faecium TaxID=1352 RepID=UPI001C613967|nr:class I SAM-dependent methyltransferase [Enterococcus faecium]EMF0453276.1 methyltransferase domain-containing protein [Enterococcus faecium]
MTKFSNYNYVDLLSFVEETNRCPGGKRTINKILQLTLLNSRNGYNLKILEIGSNTGFTSIEIAKLIPGSRVIGIDVNSNAVKAANEKLQLQTNELNDRVTFIVGDASDLPFEDNEFDLVICGGANTFINEKFREKAVAEYRRVLKPYGFLSVTNLFYNQPVPKNILEDLKKVLGFEIKPWRRSYWLNLLNNSGMEIYHYDEIEMEAKTEERVKENSYEIVSKSSKFIDLSLKDRKGLLNRWNEIMNIFNSNHKYLSFMLVILRNDVIDEQDELFTEKNIFDIKSIIKEPKLWGSNEE